MCTKKKSSIYLTASPVLFFFPSVKVKQLEGVCVSSFFFQRLYSNMTPDEDLIALQSDNSCIAPFRSLCIESMSFIVLYCLPLVCTVFLYNVATYFRTLSKNRNLDS